MDSKGGIFITRRRFQICKSWWFDDDSFGANFKETHHTLWKLKPVDVVWAETLLFNHMLHVNCQCRLVRHQESMGHDIKTMLYLWRVDYQSQNPSHDLKVPESKLGPPKSSSLCSFMESSKVNMVQGRLHSTSTLCQTHRPLFLKLNSCHFPPKHFAALSSDSSNCCFAFG